MLFNTSRSKTDISAVFVDDITIISESEEGIQRMLDKLNDWCNKWLIVIYENKSKILHFRPKARNVIGFNFNCGKRILRFLCFLYEK